MRLVSITLQINTELRVDISIISKSMLFSLVLLGIASVVGAGDQHENCEYWASIGECDLNPGYMLHSCADACSKVIVDNTDVPKDFYSIEERDIEGNIITFDRFRGKVVYIVNVASQVSSGSVE